MVRAQDITPQPGPLFPDEASWLTSRSDRHTARRACPRPPQAAAVTTARSASRATRRRIGRPIAVTNGPTSAQ